MKEVRLTAKQIKSIYTQDYLESPKKSVIIERTTSYVESVRESEDGETSEMQEKSQVIESPRSPVKKKKEMR